MVALLGGAAPADPKLSVTRLDCGKFVVNDYDGEGPRTLSDGCYLIRHGNTLMLWDAGLDDSLIGHPDVSAEQTVSLDEALVPQLARLGVRPGDIRLLGISHYHGDHLGQARHFPGAEVLIGREDFEVLKKWPAGLEKMRPWLGGNAPTVLVDEDRDVFGDGSVVMLSSPGHTPGHHSLLVRLRGGPILLTGDAAHLRDQLSSLRVPGNATDKVAALASLKRLIEVAAANHATIIVQHDPVDVGRLPGAPKAAEKTTAH